MKNPAISLRQSIAVVSVIIVLLIAGCEVFQLNSQSVLLFCTLVIGVFAYFKGYKIREIEAMALEGIRAVAVMLVINLCIGMMIAIWIAAGTVPYLLCLCLKIVRPHFFLLEAFLLCCAFSCLLGSCWLATGTIGRSYSMSPRLSKSTSFCS